MLLRKKEDKKGGKNMVCVTSKYNQELVEYIKSVGGKWHPDRKAWEIPDEEYDGVRYKANSLGITLTVMRNCAPGPGSLQATAAQGQGGARGVAPAESAAPRREGRIWLGRSRDGKYLIMRINLLAFAEDVQAVLNGTKKGARFRVMPARRKLQTRAQ
ncbi:MAG: hypothetical protein QXG08_06225 [Candidatus Methanomethyliaceae archaeon]